MKYNFTVDKIDLETTYGKVLSQIQPGSVVLECGCATGYITRFLKEEMNCKVYVIEYEQEAFDIAKQYAEGGVCGDLMQDGWTAPFEGVRFDYILFMDVLEHLYNPNRVLQQAEKLLKDDGMMLITLPNIAHNDILINLYYNEFNYQERGLLDDTHIRFFGKENLGDLFADTGLSVTRLEYSFVKTGRTEQFWEKECKASAELLEVLSKRLNGDVYQFVISVRKSAYCEKNDIKMEIVDPVPAQNEERLGIQEIHELYIRADALHNEYESKCNRLEQRLLDVISNYENEIKRQEIRYLEASHKYEDEIKRQDARFQEASHKYEDEIKRQDARFQETSQNFENDINRLKAQFHKAADNYENEIKRLEEQFRVTADNYENEINRLEVSNQETARLYEECNIALQGSEVMVRRLRDNYIALEQNHNKILNSRGWRLLLVCYKIRNILLPVDSLRWKVVKTILKPLLNLYRKIKERQVNKKLKEEPVSGAVKQKPEISAPKVTTYMTAEEAFETLWHCRRIDIMAVPHTAYVAKLLQGILWEAGLESDIHLSEPEEYEDIPYIIICPQNFKHFPRLYMAFQMEQTINPRWLTDTYMEILHNAYAVFDYSLENIKYFSNDPAIASKIYYMPIDVCKEMVMDNSGCNPKEYDVLFYGSPYIDRRQEYLKPISEKFDTRIICDKFGAELYEEMKKARIVINVHYYQNALLETTRLYETLSVSDSMVISEYSGDPQEEERLKGIVDFTEVGNVDAMMERISYWLEHEEERKAAAKENVRILQERSNATKFFLYRFLLANNRVTFDQFYNSVGDYIQFAGERVCLSLPESIVRRAAFDEDNKYGFEVFPGLKHRAGWLGCGMSYKFMLRKAKEQNMEKILICEDDVYFPPDFEERFDHVLKYIEENHDWSVFSGIMADLGRVKPLKYAADNGEEFIYLDKMISMVFNIYDKSVFELVSAWDNTKFDVNNNTVDRYLEDKHLRVLTTCPFLVGHKEDLCSTIWGQQNTIYTDLIANSSIKLKGLVEDFKKNNQQHGNEK